MIKPELKRLSWRNPLHWLAVGFGSGLSPKAPGTFGTLAAIPFYLLVMQWPLWAYATLLLVGCIGGIWICQSATRAIGMEDHGGIVWDEFMGFGITMLLAPPGWLWIAIGFLLFRLFDSPSMVLIFYLYKIFAPTYHFYFVYLYKKFYKTFLFLLSFSSCLKLL